MPKLRASAFSISSSGPITLMARYSLPCSSTKESTCIEWCSSYARGKIRRNRWAEFIPGRSASCSWECQNHTSNSSCHFHSFTAECSCCIGPIADEYWDYKACNLWVDCQRQLEYRKRYTFSQQTIPGQLYLHDCEWRVGFVALGNEVYEAVRKTGRGTEWVAQWKCQSESLAVPHPTFNEKRSSSSSDT